eukprot:5105072-Lingulodinium_polyedra.AAC.1
MGATVDLVAQARGVCVESYTLQCASAFLWRSGSSGCSGGGGSGVAAASSEPRSMDGSVTVGARDT